MAENEPDSATANELLHAAEQLDAKTTDQVDNRGKAIIQAWMAGALFVYTGTFLLLYAGFDANAVTGSMSNGYRYGNTLVISILALSQLVVGVRNRMRISDLAGHSSVKLIATLSVLVPFLAAMVLSLIGVHYWPWLNLVIAVCASMPFVLGAIGSARKARTQTIASKPSTAHPLSLPVRRTTIAVGAWLGLTGFCAGFTWFPIAGAVLTVLIIVAVCGWNARWGLPNAGSEWGSTQWMSFGASFTVLCALMLILAKTPFGGPVASTVGGLVIATVLTASAFKPARRR